MKTYNVLWIIFVVLLPALRSSGQTDKADSLYSLIHTSRDTVKMRILGEYAYELRKINPAFAIDTMKLALEMADKYKKLHFKGRLYQWLGNVYVWNNDFVSSADAYLKSVEIHSQFKDTLGLLTAYTGLGNAYGYMGDYINSEKYTLLSIKLAKASRNDRVLAFNYSNLAIIYNDRGNYAEALECFQKAGDLFEKLGNIKDLGSNYLGISGIYQQMYDSVKMEEYVQKAIVILRAAGDQKSIATAYYNMAAIRYNAKIRDQAELYLDSALTAAKSVGNYYSIADCYTMKCEMLISSGDFNEALSYGMEAMLLRKEMQDNFGLAEIYRKLGIIYRKTGDPKLSEQMLSEAIILLKEQGLRNSLYKTYYQMAHTKYALGKAEEAFAFMELYVNLKDTVDSEEAQQRITEMQTKYESVQKEKEIELLAKDNQLKEVENEKQRTTILYMIAGLVIILIFSLLLLRLFRQKQAANRVLVKQNIEIAQQKEEIQTQRDEIEAQRDEIEAQRDLVTVQKEEIEEIHSELKSSIRYAKRIQNATLPAQEIMKNCPGEHFVIFRPRDIVSGDFFWAVKVREWFLFCVADCTGHGVPGAFMSMLGITLLNEIVRRDEVSDAGLVLDQLREKTTDALQRKDETGSMEIKMYDGMDISFCAIHTTTLECHWAGANNPLYVSTNNPDPQLNPVAEGLYMLEADSQPIGPHPAAKPFTNRILQLHSGDVLYLMSDGFPDQFGGPKGRKFMAKNLRNLIAANAEKPLLSQKEALEKALNDWMNYEGHTHAQTDDITLMAVKIMG